MLSEKQAIPLRNFSRVCVKLRESARHIQIANADCFSLGFTKSLFLYKQRIESPLGEYCMHAALVLYCFSYTPNHVSYFAWIFIKLYLLQTPSLILQAGTPFSCAHIWQPFPRCLFYQYFLNSAIIAVRVVQNSNAVWWSASLAYGIFMMERLRFVRGRAHGGSNFTSLRKTSGRGEREREGERAAIMDAGGKGLNSWTRSYTLPVNSLLYAIISIYFLTAIVSAGSLYYRQ